MDRQTLHEVVTRLIGPVLPVGETNEDNRRFDNLKALCDLADDLVADIDGVGCLRSAPEFSVKRAGEFASDCLTKRIGIPDEDTPETEACDGR